MPTQTEADGTPKLVGVGAGVKEYVYNQPRAHGVNWRYIRYADVLMMYAEAVVSGGAQASNMTPLQAVNKVRGRANMSELPSVTMADIQNERILEFALEGHRFYDLLRWGKLASRFTELRNLILTSRSSYRQMTLKDSSPTSTNGCRFLLMK